MARAEFSNTVEVSGGSVVGLNSLDGTLTVGVTAVELKIGASALVNRSGLIITSDPSNAGIIYLGLKNTVSSAKAFTALQAGNAMAVDVDTDSVVPIWAIASVAGQKVHICEVKK